MQGVILERFQHYVRHTCAEGASTGHAALAKIVKDLEASTFTSNGDKRKVQVLEQFLALVPASIHATAIKVLEDCEQAGAEDLDKLSTRKKAAWHY